MVFIKRGLRERWLGGQLWLRCQIFIRDDQMHWRVAPGFHAGRLLRNSGNWLISPLTNCLGTRSMGPLSRGTRGLARVLLGLTALDKRQS